MQGMCYLFKSVLVALLHYVHNFTYFMQLYICLNILNGLASFATIFFHCKVSYRLVLASEFGM